MLQPGARTEYSAIWARIAVIELWATVLLLILWFCLGGCAPAEPLTRSEIESSGSVSPTKAGQQLSLLGWFHVLWNGKPRYMLVDYKGQWIELQLDEALLKPYDGGQGLNRKRVKIVGQRLADGVVRVLSIDVE